MTDTRDHEICPKPTEAVFPVIPSMTSSHYGGTILSLLERASYTRPHHGLIFSHTDLDSVAKELSYSKLWQVANVSPPIYSLCCQQ